MIPKKLLFLALFSMGLMLSCSKDDGPSAPDKPTITEIEPSNGPVGTPFVITGTNFSATASKNTVKIGTTTATVSAATATKLTTSVPVGATTGKVSVTVDGKTGTSTGDFTVTQPAPNNQVPVINNVDPAFDVEETIADDDPIGTIVATDADQTDVLSYVLTGTNSELFEISATGAISLADGEFLDFETTPLYDDLSVSVSDNKGGVATTNITINVIDVNEAPSISSESLAFEKAENSEDPLIGTVVATDPEGADLEFSITANSSGLFAIDAVTGVLGLEVEPLDYETATEHKIMVEVTDGTNKVSAEITITVIDDGALADDPASFITTWTTANDDEDIVIGLEINLLGEYDFQIDWGDGTLESYNEELAEVNLVHTYDIAGTYTVAIKGSFPAIKMRVGGSTPHKLTSIEQWGGANHVWKSMFNAFYDCQNMLIVATDIPNVSEVANMSFMFYGTYNLGNPDLSEWNTANVTNMSHAFENSSFNGYIEWGTGSVTNMASMFKNATLFNKSLPWDVSNVTDMSSMFEGAFTFNRSLGDWVLNPNGVNMTDMLNDSGLSVDSYDATLIGWANLDNIPVDVTLGANGLVYCNAWNASTNLSNNTNNWTIYGDYHDPNACNP